MPESKIRIETESATKLDRIIHEPARFAILAILSSVENADFLYLMNQIGLTWGNLSSHLTKLESVDYITVEKGYLGKKPRTVLRITRQGRIAFTEYRRNMRNLLELPEDRKSMSR